MNPSMRIARLSKLALALTLAGALGACGGGGSSGGLSASGPSTGVSGSSGGSGPVTPVAGATWGTAGVASASVVRSLTDVGQAGTTYYVATTGNDANDGSLNSPFATLARAAQAAAPGDTIALRAGHYAGAEITKRGTSNAWIKLTAYNGEKAVIDPNPNNNAVSLFFLDGSWSTTAQQPMYWIVTGLEIDGGDGFAVKIDAPDVRLVANRLHGSGAQAMVKLVRTATDVSIYGNEIYHTNPLAHLGSGQSQGLDMVGADRTWVANNYVHDIAAYGMFSKGNARGVVFENNLLKDIHGRGIVLGQLTGAQFMADPPYETYDGIIRNNVIINSDDACLGATSSYDVKIYNNTCYNAAISRHGAIFLTQESELGQSSTNVDIKNNLIVVSTTTGRPAVWLAANAMTDYGTLHIDNNLYWSPNGASAIYFTADDLGLWNASLDTWRATVNADKTSRIVDPQFADSSTLKLAAGSPAIDTGLSIPEVTDDAAGGRRPVGSAPDIGAYEYGAD